MTRAEPSPRLRTRVVRLSIRILVIAAAVLVLHAIMEWALDRTGRAENEQLMFGVLAGLLLAYAVLIAIPFMPGIEIGISLLMLKGAAIAPLVYLATVLGLTLALLAGRCLPHQWLSGTLSDLRLVRAAEFVDRLAPMTREERLRHLAERSPAWIRPLVGTGRYVLLAILFNLPGNSIVGGGGGIAFAAGFSRLFHTGLAILTIAIAVLPVPLTVWFAGFETFLGR